jgi:hypothetical protein
MEGVMRVATAVLGLLCATGLARADDPADENALQVHGFVSQGALLTSDNNYLAKTESGSLEFAEAGINFTKRLDDRLTAGIQLFARDLGPNSTYDATFDWLYLDYHWQDWLGLRAGRVKLPFGLYNDTSDIDAAQPVVLLPQSVYPITNRQFLLAQTGVELYGYRRLGAAGALDYQAYLGSLVLTIPSTSAVQFDNLDVPFITGGRVIWETPVEGLRLGASGLAGQIDGEFTLAAAPGIAMPVTLKARQWLSSVEYTNGGILLAAEYGREYTTTESDAPTTRTTSEQGYGLASYHWRPWFETTTYYSLLYPNVADRSGRENHQHDAAVSFRFDLTPHWLVKLEGHFMRGTAALSSDLNGDQPLSDLVNQWWLLAAKTTVYF